MRLWIYSAFWSFTCIVLVVIFVKFTVPAFLIQVSCSNKCCDPKTCLLVSGAECATGDCCDYETCKIKPASTKCRTQTNSCDLPEYCDGQTEHCPADFYVQDGLPCPDSPEASRIFRPSTFFFFFFLFLLTRQQLENSELALQYR